MKLIFRVQHATGHQVLELQGSPCYLIGRKGDIVVEDDRCSRQHALLFQDPKGFIRIRDLQSRNGTFVDDQRVSEAAIGPKTKIRIGGTTLEMLEVSASLKTHEVIPPATPWQEPAAAPSTPEPAPESEPDKAVVLSGWPGVLRSMPKAALKEYVDYIDDEGRKQSVRLLDILKERDKGD